VGWRRMKRLSRMRCFSSKSIFFYFRKLLANQFFIFTRLAGIFCKTVHKDQTRYLWDAVPVN
jgi:hypothetical protein